MYTLFHTMLSNCIFHMIYLLVYSNVFLLWQSGPDLDSSLASIIMLGIPLGIYNRVTSQN